MDVGGWLRNLDFGQYELTFIENAVDSDVLPELTEGDLEKLGVPLGDRKRLIKAIKLSLAALLGALIPSKAGRAPGDLSLVNAAERRHLTVMICDLVDSTALSARLDPEDMRAVMDAYHAACARITLFYDGFLADFRGDGILAYFGYPRAHEDDAERTVRAGLDIAAAVARLKTPAAIRSRSALASPPAWCWFAASMARVHCGTIRWSERRRTSPPAFRPWSSRGRSSSPPLHAGCLATASVCAILAVTRSRALASRSRRGRSRASPIPAAVSKRSARRV